MENGIIIIGYSIFLNGLNNSLQQDNTQTNIATLISILSLLIVTFGPTVRDVIGRHQERDKIKKDLVKEDTEIKNLESSGRKAEAESNTERALADKTYVEAMTLTMDAQKKLFDDRMLLLEQRTKENAELAEKRQLEITTLLTAIKLENTEIKAESQKIKSENWELHQENIKLIGVINKLQTAIKGLKKLIEKLLGGINKLISSYETNHKDEVIPWKPILTDDEQLLFQSDFDFKDLKIYKE